MIRLQNQVLVDGNAGFDPVADVKIVAFQCTRNRAHRIGKRSGLSAGRDLPKLPPPDFFFRSRLVDRLVEHKRPVGLHDPVASDDDSGPFLE